MDRFQQHDSVVQSHRRIGFNRLKAGSGVCYLDNAGASLYSDVQVHAFSGLLCSNIYGNPHSGNQSSKLSNDVIEQVRTRVLQFFNTTCDYYSVIFTSGTSASLKLLAESFTFAEDCMLHSEDIKPDDKDTLSKYIKATGSDVDTGLPKWENVYLKTSKCAGGKYYYTEDNHTSVIGMRQLIQDRGFHTVCINHNNYEELIKGKSDTIHTYSCNNKIRTNNGLKSCSGKIIANSNTSTSHYFKSYKGKNNLFVYPIQSNFNGQKYPINWIPECQNGKLICTCLPCNNTEFAKKITVNVNSIPEMLQEQNELVNDDMVSEQIDTVEKCVITETNCACRWFVAVDAASFVSTSVLDLSDNQPDFVVLSFYKIFGFPTGLGALIVKNSSADVLQRNYFGGGTVNVSITRDNFHVPRDSISERFEDGTVSYLDIVALNCGFDSLQNIAGSMKDIGNHTFQLARFVFKEMVAMEHSNGMPVTKLYHSNQFNDITTQGPIICFNILRSDGTYVGYAQVDKLAQAEDIHLRTGCFCNMGACQVYLGISSQTIRENFKAGHVCGDDLDLINGQPTGACRISFGYYSTLKDALVFLNFIGTCFMESTRKKQYLKDGERIMKEYFTTSMNETKFETYKCGNIDREQLNVKKKQVDAESKTYNEKKVTCDTLKFEDMLTPKNAGNLNGEISTMDFEKILKNSPGIEFNQTFSEKSGYCLKSVQENRFQIQHNDDDDVNSGLLNDKMDCLTNIFLYPVKSCGAFEVCEWEVGPRGLLYDREWMIINDTGVCLNQKREVNLCLIKPVLNLNQQLLILTAQDHPDVSVSLHNNSEQTVQGSLCHTKVCGDRVQGCDCGDEVAEWVQSVLGRGGLRLVRHSQQHVRRNRKANNKGEDSPEQQLSLANEAQYLLINRASCQAMLDHNTHTGDQDIGTLDNIISRFRANLVVKTTTAFEEDSWKRVSIGNQDFGCQGLCNRCQMICVDQNTGQKSREPLLSLTQIRNRKLTFGILLNHEDSSDHAASLKKIKVRDPLKVK